MGSFWTPSSSPLLPVPPGLRSGMRLDLACYPQVNQFRGCRTVQLLITDIRRALSPAMVDLRIYQRFRAGEVLSNQELLRLLPQRQDFVATWRYLAHYAGDGTLIEQPLALSNHIARTFASPAAAPGRSSVWMCCRNGGSSTWRRRQRCCASACVRYNRRWT